MFLRMCQVIETCSPSLALGKLAAILHPSCLRVHRLSEIISRNPISGRVSSSHIVVYTTYSHVCLYIHACMHRIYVRIIRLSSHSQFMKCLGFCVRGRGVLVKYISYQLVISRVVVCVYFRVRMFA